MFREISEPRDHKFAGPCTLSGRAAIGPLPLILVLNSILRYLIFLKVPGGREISLFLAHNSHFVIDGREPALRRLALLKVGSEGRP